MKGRITGGRFFLWYFPSILLGAILKSKLVGNPFSGIVALLFRGVELAGRLGTVVPQILSN